MDNKKITVSKFSLYGLYCPDTDILRYIGITTGTLSNRLSSHLRNPTNGKIALWFKKLKQNGKKPLIKLINEYNSYAELLVGEIDEIRQNRLINKDLLNIADGGDINPMFGKTHSIEARLKISLVQKGRIRTEAERQHMSMIMKGRYNNGGGGGGFYEWSEEQKKKMSNLHKGNKHALGYKHSKETKKILSDLHKGNSYSLGYKHSKETKTLMSINNSGENNPMFGKSLPKDVLIARSEKVKINGTYSGEKNGNFKFKILEKDLYNMFINENSPIKDIAKHYGCSIDVINKSLRKYKIYKPISNKYNLSIGEIENYREKGLSLVEIGKIYKCSNKIIHKFIKNHKHG